MKHIAIITTGLTGMLHASLEITSRLQSEGYQVTYLCPFDRKDEIEHVGIDYIQLPEIAFNFTKPHKGLTKNRLQRILRFNVVEKEDYNFGKKELNLTTYKEVLAKLKPDIVLVDRELPEIIFTAIDLKYEVFLLDQWYSNRHRKNVPPLQTMIQPNMGFSGSRVGILLAWIRLRIHVWKRILIDTLKLKNYRKIILKRYALEVGIKGKQLLNSHFPPLFLYTDLPILSLTNEALDFPGVPHQNVVHTGALIFEKRLEMAIEPQVMKRINTIIIRKKEEHKKLIYCSVSTLNSGDHYFLKKVIAAAKDLPKCLLIVSLGGKIDSADFSIVPENVYLFNWVPQLNILAASDCSINHGGIHTIQECIHFSVPMLVYSGKRYDQNGCAARVAFHKLGIIGDKDRDTTQEIVGKIEEVLTASAYKNNLLEMNRKYTLSKKRPFSSFITKK